MESPALHGTLGFTLWGRGGEEPEHPGGAGQGAPAAHHEKIEALEDKIKTEMTTLKEKMSHMEEKMATFTDLARLRREAEERRAGLEEEREVLQARLPFGT